MKVSYCYAYSFSEEENILSVRLFNKLHLKSSIAILRELLSQLRRYPNCGVLMDCREVEYSNSIGDISIFTSILMEYYKGIDNHRIIFISGSPKQVVFATLFKHVLGARGEKVQVCSTEEYAKSYLSLAY